MPGATSSVLATSSRERQELLVASLPLVAAMPGATSSVLATSSRDARSY